MNGRGLETKIFKYQNYSLESEISQNQNWGYEEKKMTKLYKEKEDIYSKSTEKANIFVLLETNDIDAFIYYPKVGNYKNSNKTFSKIEFGTGGDIFSIYY